MNAADKKQLSVTLQQMRRMIGLLDWYVTQDLKREGHYGAVAELNHEAAKLDAEVIMMMERLAPAPKPPKHAPGEPRDLLKALAASLQPKARD